MTKPKALGAIALSTALCFIATVEARSTDPLARARQLLDSTVLIDGHNDLPFWIIMQTKGVGDLSQVDFARGYEGQTDLPRLRAGKVGAQFWSVYVSGEEPGPHLIGVLQQIDLSKRLFARYPQDMQFATTAAEIRAAHADGRIASLIGVEGGHMMENSLDVLRTFYALGVRYMTLTHFSHNDWADSGTHIPLRHKGLSSFGEEVVREMNRLGMMVDLAHTAPDTMADALRVSEAPVMFSHADARGLVDHPRNVPDDILKALSKNGGVLMVSLIPDFVSPEIAKQMGPALIEFGRRARAAKSKEELTRIEDEFFSPQRMAKLPRANLAHVADMVEYVRRVAGVDHVGIGADYGSGVPMPEGMEDVSSYPHLFAELIRRGWSDADLRKLAGENLLRVMTEVEATAKRLQKTRSPSVAALSGAGGSP